MQNLLKVSILFLSLFIFNTSLFAQNTPFTGTWNSSYGNLMLIQVGNQVSGDYSTVGTIAGTYNPSTRQLTGSFDNQKYNIKGSLVFTLNAAGTAFTGKWGRENQPMNGNWSATKTSSNTPVLKIAKAPDINYGDLQMGNWTNPLNKGTVIIMEKGKDYTVKNNFPVNNNNTANTNAAYIPPKTPSKTVKVWTENGDKVDVKTTLGKKSSSNQADDVNARLTDLPHTKRDNCITKTLDFSAEKTDLSAFMASSTIDWLLPGNLFYSPSIVDGSYQIPNYARKSISLTASIYGNGLKNSFTVQNPKISTINQTMNNFIAANALPHGASLRKVEKQVHTKSDLSVAVFGKYDGKVNGVKAQLGINFAQNKTKSYHLIDFTQSLYEVAVDNIDAKNHFNGSVSANEIANMAYISSVVYGRRAIMVCETEMSKTDFNTAFQAAYSNSVMDARGKLKVEFKKFFDKTNLYVLIYGGSETAGLKAVSLSPKEAAKGFRNYINTSFQQSGRSTAKPISYKFKFLADNSTCMVRTVFKQPVPKCTPLSDALYDLRIKITKVDCIKSDDSDKTDDYRITAAANFKVNNQRQNFKSIHFEGPQKSFQQSSSPASKNRLMYFDEKHQLHVHESRNQPIGSYGIYALPDLNDATKRMDLTLQLWMCERTGDGCGGMVATGGNRYAINLQEVLNLLTGTTAPDNYAPGKNGILNLGSGYSKMYAIKSPVTDSQEVKKMSGKMYARNNDKSREAAIYYEIELLKRTK